MIRVRVFRYRRWALTEFQDFTREHDAEILGMNRHNLSVILRSGDELHFVPHSSFDNWSRGRKFEIEEWSV